MSPRTEIIGDTTLYLGDCREIQPTLAPVSAVVTDPPNGIAESACTYDAVALSVNAMFSGRAPTSAATDRYASAIGASLDDPTSPLAFTAVAVLVATALRGVAVAYRFSRR